MGRRTAVASIPATVVPPKVDQAKRGRTRSCQKSDQERIEMMGIYDSGLSCWERNKRSLPNDNAGKGILGEVVNDGKVVKKPLVEEPVAEEEPVEEAEKTSKKKVVSAKVKKILKDD